MVALGIMCVVSACGAPVTTGPPRAEVNGEILQGMVFGDAPSEVVFKGIPFAAPPIGESRWKPPAPIQPRPGVVSATEYGPACIQSNGNIVFQRDIAAVFGTDPDLVPELWTTSEDCLYLNVWTDNWGGDELRPVMVWIYGGNNMDGTAAESPYDGGNLARKGAVVVTFNYRVNVFGFLAHPDLTAESEQASSGNYALLDQMAALQWVQRNIATFGGDPGRVTIFGESAGATNVAYLLASPLAKGLFHRAVVQSGGYTVSEFRTLKDGEQTGEGLAEALGVDDSEDVLAAMRSLGADQIHSTALETIPLGVNFPVVDGWVLPDAPARIFEAGHHNDVPLVIGVTADEWTTLRGYFPDVTVDRMRLLLGSMYGGLAPEALELYPATTDDEAFVAADRALTDWWFVCPSKFIADRMDRVSSPAYFYVFTRRLSAPGGEELGAYHAAELPYVFDNLDDEPWVPRLEYDQELADMMSTYWVQFATSGNPNVEGFPGWPRYTVESEDYLELGDEVGARAQIRPGICDLFDELHASRMADGG
jgi:para-nitrobenzyl esterase